MFAGDQPALPVAGIAVGVVGRLAEHARRAGFLVPAPDAIARHVAPEQIAPVAEPDRPLAPTRAGPETFDARERQPVFVEAPIERLNERIGITQARRPAAARSILAVCHACLPAKVIIERMDNDFTHDVGQGFAGKALKGCPARVLWRLGRARHRRDEDRKLERKMREDVTHDARQRASTLRPSSAALNAARDFSSKSCAHSLPGTSVIDASRPLSGRLRSSTRPSARSATKAAPRRNWPSRLGALRGNVS